MNQQLMLDLHSIQSMQNELTAIARDFNNADQVSHQLSGAVGGNIGGSVAGLAHQVDRFASGWDIRRGQITKAMDAINASLKAIHDTFTELDGKLAAALTQGGNQ